MTLCGALRGCLEDEFDSCNSLLSSVHTLLVNILPCVRLYIKNENIIIIIYRQSKAKHSLQKSELMQEISCIIEFAEEFA